MAGPRVRGRPPDRRRAVRAPEGSGPPAAAARRHGRRRGADLLALSGLRCAEAVRGTSPRRARVSVRVAPKGGTGRRCKAAGTRGGCCRLGSARGAAQGTHRVKAGRDAATPRAAVAQASGASRRPQRCGCAHRPAVVATAPRPKAVPGAGAVSEAGGSHATVGPHGGGRAGEQADGRRGCDPAGLPRPRPVHAALRGPRGRGPLAAARADRDPAGRVERAAAVGAQPSGDTGPAPNTRRGTGGPQPRPNLLRPRGARPARRGEQNRVATRSDLEDGGSAGTVAERPRAGALDAGHRDRGRERGPGALARPGDPGRGRGASSEQAESARHPVVGEDRRRGRGLGPRDCRKCLRFRFTPWTGHSPPAPAPE
eukprot:m.335252 g.335252  ORF g.335252 m.335252 type:complete len:370 (+) comp27767_c0_seq1:1067-2176(+)